MSSLKRPRTSTEKSERSPTSNVKRQRSAILRSIHKKYNTITHKGIPMENPRSIYRLSKPDDRLHCSKSSNDLNLTNSDDGASCNHQILHSTKLDNVISNHEIEKPPDINEDYVNQYTTDVTKNNDRDGKRKYKIKEKQQQRASVQMRETNTKIGKLTDAITKLAQSQQTNNELFAQFIQTANLLLAKSIPNQQENNTESTPQGEVGQPNVVQNQ